VLVTGATGFIGGHLVRANLERGRRVRALVLPGDPDKGALAARGVDVVDGDIRDAAKVREAVAGVDVVFHCAAVVTDWAPRRLFREVTVGGAENVCRAAAEAKVRRLVDISTNDVFGRDESIVMDETLPLAPWGEPYPDAKIAAERIMWRWHREHGVPVTMVYPCWVYGPGDRTFVPLLADAIVKRELIFWRKDVLVWPTYVENLVDLLLVISEDERAVGSGYLVHDGESTTLQAFCGRIAETLGVAPVTTRIPYALAYAAAIVLEGLWRLLRRRTRPLLTTYTVKNLGSRLRFSIGKAGRELGWKPRIPFSEGFARTMDWLRTLDRATLKGK
jgi:nucleoside-diphosphate-sugar epimerase